ncbi:haloacid dehalogenase-like hydrolase [Lunatimonas salinarum]|uniref:haloacid dehalogenase-like hydrolase n=1 Tax=Lunatimonas salinarum TaxID=1774590 RepID=UPI001ADEF44D|nr:haloacid dehalogenase-like hydrolase [Lunatimonas salinarum]
MTTLPYVFDVCGTLYHSNTTYDFLLYYFRRHDGRKYRILRLGLSLPIKVLVVVSSKIGWKWDLRKHLIGLLSGEPEAKLRAVATHFVANWLTGREIDDVHTLLQQAKAQGHPVTLASGSLAPVIQAIADRLKVDDFHASTLETDAYGVLTGKYLSDIKGCKEQALGLKDHTYILATDNLDDLPLIQKALKAYIVTKRKNLNNWKKRLSGLDVAYVVVK